MKKTLIFFLIFLSIFRISACADKIELYSVPFPMDDINAVMIVNILKTSEKVYVGGFQIDLEKEGDKYFADGKTMSFLMKDGVHKAQISGNKLFYQLFPGGATIALSKADPFDPSLCTDDGTFKILQKEEIEPITIPSGVYIAGEDFPAGKYRIDLANEKKSGKIRLYRNMEDVTSPFSYLYEYGLGSYYGTNTVGKILIETGNALEVRDTTIIISPYEGLK